MQLVRMLMLISGFYVCTSACAAMPEGTWKFDRSADYFGEIPVNQAPEFTTLEFRNNEVKLAATCSAQIRVSSFSFPRVFQPLTKQGISAKQLDNFLLRYFHLSLAKTTEVYGLSSPADCADPMMAFFVVGDRIVMETGATFYTYVKAESAVASSAVASPSVPIVSGYKLTRLPLDYERYYSSCLPKIRNAKGQPQTTEKCAPDYFPYVADPKSADPLMTLVGNHDYAKAGEEYAFDFSPPFKQKVPATFLVFAPMKQVVLIRVDDFAVVRNEARDVMSGVYLSIVGGKVVDQISGCQFNSDYVCINQGRPVAKLTEAGKFQRLK